MLTYILSFNTFYTTHVSSLFTLVWIAFSGYILIWLFCWFTLTSKTKAQLGMAWGAVPCLDGEMVQAAKLLERKGLINNLHAESVLCHAVHKEGGDDLCLYFCSSWR